MMMITAIGGTAIGIIQIAGETPGETETGIEVATEIKTMILKIIPEIFLTAAGLDIEIETEDMTLKKITAVG